MATKTALVTGAAGFIGLHLCLRLLADGFRVVGLDSHNDYYDPALKTAREALLLVDLNYTAIRGKVEEPGLLRQLCEQHRPDFIVHLAAQAGVRYSIENPRAYTEANLMGTFELLEAARAFPPKHLLMASTSSVYGANTQMPYRETDKVDSQMSYYAATKKANEAMAHSYAHLYGLPITMFRFFTVYGPWGRPDMAPYLFTKAIFDGTPIKVFNHGNMLRDFTYVTDLVRGIRLLMDVIPDHTMNDTRSKADSLSQVAPWRAVNIGNGVSVKLLDFIRALEQAAGRSAEMIYEDMQAGDVPATWADTTLLQDLTGYAPRTSVVDGTQAYVAWHQSFYHSSG
ncbi:SDR family NAD(P)-dependent oxidoreductase [Yoonia sediminilitoris]|uniref:UDP-glucuronate 4-epimerase n=1 Tax=Yoonia sediminilitoris TaxID=1286148 RepID=A0A2T6KD35_9RHOB|nr:SDR family NAD(P)-dependent oxidoreductase [Yoonia sediminilitoris]PUB12840.1 UDP-glucuronate 4-epimerase [Yoonia sediminilitoris]RCW94319.1 UDP-glucuronate 4-epimerase [Yoonia sediminilitoris]